MTLRRKLVLLIPALLLPLAGWCDGDYKWSNPDKKFRSLIETMKVYYEPENTKRDGDTVALKTYRSSDPANQDLAGSYVLNCKTQEFVSLNKNGEPLGPPSKVLPSETMYPIGQKLCDWGPSLLRKLWNDS